MARRSSWRIPVRVRVNCRIGMHIYNGTVLNFSERGMFINCDEISIPENPLIEVTIPLKKEVMKLTAKLIRSVKKNGGADMGVEVMNPPSSYTHFIENLLYVL